MGRLWIAGARNAPSEDGTVTDTQDKTKKKEKPSGWASRTLDWLDRKAWKQTVKVIPAPSPQQPNGEGTIVPGAIDRAEGSTEGITAPAAVETKPAPVSVAVTEKGEDKAKAEEVRAADSPAEEGKSATAPAAEQVELPSAPVAEEVTPTRASIVEEDKPGSGAVVKESSSDATPVVEEPKPVSSASDKESTPDAGTVVEEPKPVSAPAVEESTSDAAPVAEEPKPAPAPVAEEPKPAPAPAVEEPRAALAPEKRPRSIEETGIRPALLEDLALKVLYTSGSLSVVDLGSRMCLGYELADEIFRSLRGRLLCEVTGLMANIPIIAITQAGRSRATELLSQCQYVGAAPVSLESYVEVVRAQSVRNVTVKRTEVEEAFASFVLDERLLSQFGSALNSGEAIFIYGSPGVGKTAAALTLSSVLAKYGVWIPHAIEVDGQIIVVFDPSVHKRLDEPQKGDGRWVWCHRPTIMVGGELTMEMLDLQLDPTSNLYIAPAQMKANNGTLIIDDFGRQRVSPNEMLNRWVVPLDRGIEFFTLAGGRKIEIPFALRVIFASNIDPFKLIDPAFLRRIQTKIKVNPVNPEQFREIFRRAARERGMETDEEALGKLVATIQDEIKEHLRACYPRDLINQVAWAARYDGTKPRLDGASLEKAVAAYFLEREE